MISHYLDTKEQEATLGTNMVYGIGGFHYIGF